MGIHRGQWHHPRFFRKRRVFIETVKHPNEKNTVGARIPKAFGFRMVQSCSIGEWFGFRMVWTKWLPFCSDFECSVFECSVFQCSVFEWSVPVHIWYWNGWNGPFEIQTIPIQNMKTFGIRMDSVFECSVFEPPLYLLIFKVKYDSLGDYVLLASQGIGLITNPTCGSICLDS